jgi:isopentenyl-diphosphate delta-isomerase type 1
MESEIIEVVDKNGEVIMRTRRSTAYKKGLLHKAVNMLIFNKRNKMYMQQRSKNKSSFPLFWDISASEHVKPGESYENAAQRGLKEELSILTKIRKIRQKHIQRSEYFKNGKKIIEHELVELYKGTFDGKIQIDKSEVKDGKFVFLKSLKSQIRLKKIKLTPWALDEIQFLLKNLKTLKLL